MPTGTEGEWKIRRLAVAGHGRHRWGSNPLASRPAAFHLVEAPYPSESSPSHQGSAVEAPLARSEGSSDPSPSHQGTAVSDAAPSSLSGSWLPAA